MLALNCRSGLLEADLSYQMARYFFSLLFLFAELGCPLELLIGYRESMALLKINIRLQNETYV
jgi:hypothetical protein